MSEPKRFDPKNAQDIKGLQEKLNALNALNKDKQPALELTGKLDEATNDAWLRFKKEVFADSSLNNGYLKDRFKLSAPQGMDRDKPPAEIVKSVQEKLGVKPTGSMDEATKAAIKDDKSSNWIDARINDGALEKLDAEIKSRNAAKGMSATTIIMGAAAVAAAGVATAAAFGAFSAAKDGPSR